jgi:hypothetical protein
MSKIKKKYLDFDVYEKSEVDTISGTLQSQIDIIEGSDISNYYDKDEVDTISGSLSYDIAYEIIQHAESDDHDDRYYTEIEVDGLISTISGGGSSDVASFLDLTDTPAAYDVGKFLRSTASGIEFVNLSTSSGTIFVHYGMSAGQTIANNTGTRLDFDESIVDTHSAVTTGGSWVFTAPEAGYYCCWVKVQYDTFNWTTCLNNLGIYFNGVGKTVDYNTGTNGVWTISGFGSEYLEAGQTIYTNAWQNSGGDRTLRSSSSPSYNYIQIFKLGGINESSNTQTILELTDTPASYDDGKYLKSTSNGTEWATVSGGTTTGVVVQMTNYQTGTAASTSATIPYDNSPPQSNEGAQFMSLAITPIKATNKLKIDVVMALSSSEADILIAALFKDNDASAIAAMAHYVGVSDVSSPKFINFSYTMVAGTTSEITFKVNAGAPTGTVGFNGVGGNSFFGGVYASSMNITEIEV